MSVGAVTKNVEMKMNPKMFSEEKKLFRQHTSLPSKSPFVALTPWEETKFNVSEIISNGDVNTLFLSLALVLPCQLI